MCNIGKIDKFLRVLIGFIIMGYGVYDKNFWGMIGLVPIATAAIDFCPLYAIFKINTGCKSKIV